MVRIARVKFTGHSKMYDYFCDNKEIEEGAVVNVEGQEDPYYVYEIAEVDEKDCRATKRITGFAKENPNVVISSRYMDITKSESDCIVNSLGPDTSVFGAICNSIVHNAKSAEIDKMLKDNPKAKIFDMFVTDGGELPCRHIIHIVMPFKHEDHHNQNLKLAFRKVIELAIGNGYESIAIPYIGTGANGYERSDIADALNDIMFRFQYKSGIKIRITSILYSHTKWHDMESMMERRGKGLRVTNRNVMPEEGEVCCGAAPDAFFDLMADPRSQMDIVKRVIAEKYRESDALDMTAFGNPVDFIRECRKKHKNYYEENGTDCVFGSYTEENMENFYRNPRNAGKQHIKFNDTLTSIAKGGRKMAKIEVFRIGIFLHMNFTEFIQLMDAFGFSFTPFSKLNLDYMVFDYAQMNNGFVDSDLDIRDYFYECGSDEIYDTLFELDNNLMRCS